MQSSTSVLSITFVVLCSACGDNNKNNAPDAPRGPDASAPDAYLPPPGIGITIPDGTSLQNVLAVSGDGTVLIGTAADATSQHTFVLRVAAGTF